MEKQLKKKSSARLDEYLGFSWGWKLNFKRNGNAQIKSIAISKVVELLYVRKQVATI
jgi:hypothetical protein